VFEISTSHGHYGHVQTYGKPTVLSGSLYLFPMNMAVSFSPSGLPGAMGHEVSQACLRRGAMESPGGFGF